MAYNDNQKYARGDQYTYTYNSRRNNKRNRSRPSLPDGYLEGGYYRDPEKKEKLKPEYIVKYPQELVESFAKEGRNNGNKRSQIRKFYEYLRRIEKKMENVNGDFFMVEAYLLELIPKVTYAEDRGVVTEIFKQFIEKNVEAVKDDRDLSAFVKHFESVIAYTKKDR